MGNDLIYNKEYYKSHCGQDYERSPEWTQFFGNIADRIAEEIAPKTVLDVGCAKGFLVEALRDRSIDAFGIDISEYAISEVRKDIRPYCKVESAEKPITSHFDLITCIEVFEHLDESAIHMAIKNLCNASDDIIFSSTPFDYQEETHISIHPIEYWVEKFSYNGFYHDIEYDCTYIAPQAMRFKRGLKDKYELQRDYERQLFQLICKMAALKQQLSAEKEKTGLFQKAYQEQIDLINTDLNPEILRLNKLLDEISEKASSEAENRCRIILNQEVLKRKELEDRYSQQLKEVEETAQNNAEEKCRLILDSEIAKRKYAEDMLIKERIDCQKLIDESYKNICYMQNEVERITQRYEKSFSWRVMAPVRTLAKKFLKLLGRM